MTTLDEVLYQVYRHPNALTVALSPIGKPFILTDHASQRCTLGVSGIGVAIQCRAVWSGSRSADGKRLGG